MLKLFRWSTTRPQSYVVYVVLLLAVYGLSYLAGALRPHKAGGAALTTISEPQK